MKINNELRKLKLKHRNMLPFLLNELGLDGVGVELGVFKGNFSEIILESSNLEKLYSIDCWKHLKEDDNILNVKNIKQLRYYLITKSKLKRFGDRSKIIKSFSHKAVKRFTNQHFDFIYMDAGHSYKDAKQDVELWFPKLKVGGVFAGDDFCDGETDVGTHGVKKAIIEYMEKDNQEINIIPSHNGKPYETNFYVIKNGGGIKCPEINMETN